MENKLSFKPLQELSLEELRSLHEQYQEHLVREGDNPLFNPAPIKEFMDEIEYNIFIKELPKEYQDEQMDEKKSYEGASGSGVTNTDKEQASGSSTLKRSRDADNLSSSTSSDDSSEKRLKCIHEVSFDYENPQPGTSGLKFSNPSVSTSTTDDDD